MSNYDKDIKNFSEFQKNLKSIATEQIKASRTKKDFYDCRICKRYANIDTKSVLVHLITVHREILHLIKLTR